MYVVPITPFHGCAQRMTLFVDLVAPRVKNAQEVITALILTMISNTGCTLQGIDLDAPLIVPLSEIILGPLAPEGHCGTAVLSLDCNCPVVATLSMDHQPLCPPF